MKCVECEVTSDHSALDILDGHVLDVESDVVTRLSRLELLVVHLDGLDLSGHLRGGESHGHAGLEDAGLDAADGHCADSADLVHILEGKAEGKIVGALGGDDGVKHLQKDGTLSNSNNTKHSRRPKVRSCRLKQAEQRTSAAAAVCVDGSND